MKNNNGKEQENSPQCGVKEHLKFRMQQKTNDPLAKNKKTYDLCRGAVLNLILGSTCSDL